MAVELQVLGWAGVLAIVQLVIFSAVANRELPQRWLVGPRDTPMPKEMSALCGRMQRAFNNHIEGLILFAIAAAVVVAGAASSPLTEGAAIIYLIARIAYAPVYWAGIPWLRSAIWGVGMLATLVMLLAALL
ncbi:MAG: MAPEG family protein [Pseudomonadota bacterium]